MSLTREEWVTAAATLYKLHNSQDERFELSETIDGPVLSLHRWLVQTTEVAQAPEQTSEVDINEVDSERLERQGSQATEVIWSIRYSDSYQVPVLMVRVYVDDHQQQLPVEKLHDLLVRETSRSQLESGGPLGMLTLHDDPVLGPVYRVHPCRTQEVMSQMLAGRDCSPIRYLVLWLGVYGPSVGLTLTQSTALSIQTILETEADYGHWR